MTDGYDTWFGGLGAVSRFLCRSAKETLGGSAVSRDTIDLDLHFLLMQSASRFIRRHQPLMRLSTSSEILETGDQGYRPASPYLKVEKLVSLVVQVEGELSDSGIDPQHCPRARWDFCLYRCW